MIHQLDIHHSFPDPVTSFGFNHLPEDSDEAAEAETKTETETGTQRSVEFSSKFNQKKIPVGVMYGLLLKNLQAYIIQSYGAKKWKEIKGVLKIDQVSPEPGY